MPEEASGTFDPEVDLNDDAVGREAIVITFVRHLMTNANTIASYFVKEILLESH